MQLQFIVIEDLLSTNLWFDVKTGSFHFFAWKMVLRNDATNTILNFLTTIPQERAFIVN